MKRTESELCGDSEEIEFVEYTNDGVLTYIKGHDYPQHGLPHIQAVDIANEVKRAFKNPLTLTWKARPLLEAFYPYTQHPLSPFPSEVYTHFPSKIGRLAAFVLEFDLAYRYRIQDLLSETTKDRLSSRPIREIWRLLGINKRRDYQEVHRKLIFFGILATILLVLPNLRRSFKKKLAACNFQRLQPDKNDLFWIKKRLDYHYDK